MIIENTTIINPAQVVYAKRRGKMLFVTTTAIASSAIVHYERDIQSLDSVELGFEDPDGDLFADLAREIERLSPPRPI